VKQLFLKITSIILSFTVLLSTFSFTVDKHFCGEFLVDVSFTGDAEGCGMETDAETAKMKNCCKDEIIKIEGQDELKLTSFDDISFKNQQFLVAVNYSYLSLFQEDLSLDFVFKEFPPPDITTKFQVVYQTFLI